MARWGPAKILRRYARDLAQRIADSIRHARPRVPHRDGRKSPGPLGGGLPSEVKRLVKNKRGAYVVQLGEVRKVLGFFAEGTDRQAARPIDESVDEEALARELEDDLNAHLARELGT